MSDERKIDRLLRFDPLAAAEQMTGGDYKQDDETMRLGFLLAQGHSRAKESALLGEDDTLLSNDLDRYVRIVGELGFEKVLETDFSGHDQPEKFFLYARRDGLLLSFDTYGLTRMNGGKLYYNWKCSDEVMPYEILSSGGFQPPAGAASFDDAPRAEWIWVGDHDAREALRFKIAQLERRGTFVTPWLPNRFLWLLGYGEDHTHYQKLSEDRVRQCPAWVQEMVLDEAKRQPASEAAARVEVESSRERSTPNPTPGGGEHG